MKFRFLMSFFIIVSFTTNFIMANAKPSISKEDEAILTKAANDLAKSDIIKNSISVGQKIADFTLPDINNNKVTLYNELKDNIIILSFYRGGWCPVCNIQLHSLQNYLSEFDKLGAKLIAVSPETPDNSLTTAKKNEISFKVLSDVGNLVGKKYGLVFTIPKDARHIYKNFGIDIEKHNGDDKFEIPITATFIINKNAKIIYAFKDTDYKNRADPEEIIKILEKFNQ